VYEYAGPYGAPQYNASKGHITQCDGCYERVAVGLQTICVTSCPLRCRHLRGAGRQPAVLAISAVVLVGAELIGRLLFYNLHMTVGSLLLVLSQLAMEDR
jgi:Fe-S-cluster-containing dehydrogenase component